MEVIVGAILTQSTSWKNVEKALTQLRRRKVLSFKTLSAIEPGELAALIRSSGYFRQKAKRLKGFVSFLDSTYNGSLRRMLCARTEQQIQNLRTELLELKGIGPETADSILLYAGNYLVFPVDAYTRRVFARHNIVREDADYEEIRSLVEKALCVCRFESGSTSKRTGHPPRRMSCATRSPAAQHLNEFHALIVQVGKNYCFKTEPNCDACPLKLVLPI